MSLGGGAGKKRKEEGVAVDLGWKEKTDRWEKGVAILSRGQPSFSCLGRAFRGRIRRTCAETRETAFIIVGMEGEKRERW